MPRLPAGVVNLLANVVRLSLAAASDFVGLAAPLDDLTALTRRYRPRRSIAG